VDPTRPADPPERFQSEAASQAWHDEHMAADGFHLIIVKYTDEADLGTPPRYSRTT
jgi:hypothetical protein